MSSKKTRRLVRMLKQKARKISLKIKYQQTGRIELVKNVDVIRASFLRSPEWRLLRKLAIARYGSTCVKCGRVGSKESPINIDHIKPRKYFPELALDINNLQPLCSPCNKRKGNKVEPLGNLLSKRNESE